MMKKRTIFGMGIAVGIILTIGISVYAASSLLASHVTYKDGTVEDALNALYQKVGTENTTCNSSMLNHTWTYEYDSNSDFRLFVPPCEGTYKVELWGAQGGNATYNSNTYRGGYGGYTTGSISVTSGDYYFVYIGGQGGYNSGYEGKATGGYNGGGDGYTSSSGVVGAGGGATHIATKMGTLANLSSNQSSVIMVAAGGGGAQNNYTYTSYAPGGDAGGFEGGASSDYQTSRTNTSNIGTGGTQNAGGTAGAFYNSSYDSISANKSTGTFGQGGTYSGTSGYVAGGGGGYYGGASCYLVGGTGGSSYFDSSKVTNGKMVCYNCTPSDTPATKTVTNECHNSTATADCAKEGNGSVRITLISYN